MYVGSKMAADGTDKPRFDSGRGLLLIPLSNRVINPDPRDNFIIHRQRSSCQLLSCKTRGLISDTNGRESDGSWREKIGGESKKENKEKDVKNGKENEEKREESERERKRRKRFWCSIGSKGRGGV